MGLVGVAVGTDEEHSMVGVTVWVVVVVMIKGEGLGQGSEEGVGKTVM